MTDPQQHCFYGLQLPPSLIEKLRHIPHGSDEINLLYWCELVYGHQGPHIAIGQWLATNRDYYWVQWTDASIEIIKKSPCDYDSPEDVDDETCDQPLHHEGPHSYQLSGGRKHVILTQSIAPAECPCAFCNQLRHGPWPVTAVPEDPGLPFAWP